MNAKLINTVIFLFLFLVVFAVGHVAAEEPCPFEEQKRFMIENDLKARDITCADVLGAMERVPRHLFVSQRYRPYAYADRPLRIDQGQTISQPYIVALMTQILEVKDTDKVLEIGTGSGYQAAVLAELADKVYTIEIHEKLANQARELLQTLGYDNVWVKAGDGFFGWKEHAPFDSIMITCAVNKIPPALVDQLKEGGKIILPLGEQHRTQTLVLAKKKEGKIEKQTIIPVRFVPMTGEAQKE